MACGPCEKKTGRRFFVAQLEREGTRLDLTAFTTAVGKEAARLKGELEDARRSGDAAAVAEAEQRIAQHRTKLRAQLGRYRYTFDLRNDLTDKTYEVPCPNHGTLVVAGSDLAAALSRYTRENPVVIRAMRPHSA